MLYSIHYNNLCSKQKADSKSMHHMSINNVLELSDEDEENNSTCEDVDAKRCTPGK